MSPHLDGLASTPALTWAPLLALTVIFLVGLIAFVLKSAIWGRPHSKRAGELGGSMLLSEYFLDYGVWMFSPVVRMAVRLHIHPDAISRASLVLQILAAGAIAQGWFALGGWILLFGAAGDLLDGAVAREQGVASDAGAVLDAVIDRWAEMALFFGYAWYYRDFPLGFVLAAAACAGAVTVSYARAKGEGLGVRARMGAMQRHERGVYLVAATIISSLVELGWPSSGRPRHVLVLAALGLIAIFANVTGMRRTAFIRAELRKR